ncbi:hypothetical protein KC316_g36 [Hortaea werneckii]|nr:hypothetical protein KC316_g36 [Hortaea werneckii]
MSRSYVVVRSARDVAAVILTRRLRRTDRSVEHHDFKLYSDLSHHISAVTPEHDMPRTFRKTYQSCQLTLLIIPAARFAIVWTNFTRALQHIGIVSRPSGRGKLYSFKQWQVGNDLLRLLTLPNFFRPSVHRHSLDSHDGMAAHDIFCRLHKVHD